MILTADIGNTNICFALHPDDAPEPLFFERIHTDREKTALEYIVDLNLILKLHSIDVRSVRSAALSSVVPSVTGRVREALEDLLHCPVLTVAWGLPMGFENRAEDPYSVGSDILCDVACAVAEYPLPLITVDMGTATVLSIVSAVPALEGVLISAGVRTSMNSMTQKTSALTAVALEAPEHCIGRNTLDSVRSGLIFGTAGMLDGVIRRIEEETGTSCTVIVTGGLSTVVAPHVQHPLITDPTLLMRGLWYILKKKESTEKI